MQHFAWAGDVSEEVTLKCGLSSAEANFYLIGIKLTLTNTSHIVLSNRNGETDFAAVVVVF